MDVADLPFHLAVLMPMSGDWIVGPRIAGAAALAVEEVNADSALLPGRVLEYSWDDSGCSLKQGIAALSELLRGETKVSAVIGPGCSAACKVTSYMSAGESIPQISWGCGSPLFSDKDEYKLVCLIEGAWVCLLEGACILGCFEL